MTVLRTVILSEPKDLIGLALYTVILSEAEGLIGLALYTVILSEAEGSHSAGTFTVILSEPKDLFLSSRERVASGRREIPPPWSG